MTAFAGARATYRPYLPPVREGALDGVRGSLRQWRTAFRLAASPSSQDADFPALLMLGRD